MKRLCAPLLALVATLVTDTSVAAGIDTQSRALFEAMVNVTNPSAHMGQRRGAFAAGSVVTRNRLMNESLWHFVPPSFEAGCGGIDMFAGSFSFISAEQFQQLLRSIAANATGYAFEVALTAMCPTCVEVMESLQRKLQALNQGYANSCQLAKGLVNDVASAFDIQHKDNTSLVAMAKGLGDVFETRSTATGESPIDLVRDNLSEEERAEANLQGNLVWQALKRQGAAGWFVGGDDALLEAIMSVTGSVILGPPEAAPDGAGENFGVTLLPGNVMTVRDLLWGSSAHEDNSSGQSTTAHVIKRYRCDTTIANGCTAPTVLTDTETVGLVQHTKNLLLGDPTVSGSVGLVQKFRLGAEAASAPEQAFMEASRPTAWAHSCATSRATTRAWRASSPARPRRSSRWRWPSCILLGPAAGGGARPGPGAACLHQPGGQPDPIRPRAGVPGVRGTRQALRQRPDPARLLPRPHESGEGPTRVHPGPALASATPMFEIYSIGDAAYLAAVLNAVAMLSGTGNMAQLAGVGFLIGVILVTFQGLVQARAPQYQHMLIALGCIWGCSAPRRGSASRTSTRGAYAPWTTCPWGSPPSGPPCPRWATG